MSRAALAVPQRVHPTAPRSQALQDRRTQLPTSTAARRSSCSNPRWHTSHADARKSTPSCRAQVLELLTELIDEMDLAEDAIVAKATTHIHANEVILTFGLSQTTLKFLLKAAERRTFQVRPRSSPGALPVLEPCSRQGESVGVVQVVVAEGAPKLQGLTMARHLTDAGIPTLVIPDACTFALMARVNKVLVGAQAVLATGGVVCQSGSRLVALAARHHRVPFVVVTGALSCIEGMRTVRSKRACTRAPRCVWL